MKTPRLPCKIEAFCSINPSENSEKVQHAISNILINTDITKDDFSIRSTSNNLESLEKLYEIIHSKQNQNVLKRHLNRNLVNDSTWFYLNKQAAFVNVIALCDEADESPLGPIKVTLTSKNIESIIDWLVLD